MGGRLSSVSFLPHRSQATSVLNSGHIPRGRARPDRCSKILYPSDRIPHLTGGVPPSRRPGDPQLRVFLTYTWVPFSLPLCLHTSPEGEVYECMDRTHMLSVQTLNGIFCFLSTAFRFV